MLGAILTGFRRGKAVTRLDVVKVDDLHCEILGHGIFDYIGTPARHCNEYLIHREFPRDSNVICRRISRRNGLPCALPISKIAAEKSHLYLWCPNALLAWGLQTMKAWGFEYKTNIVWLKVRKDGGPDGRGVGFYYRNVTELVLFGTRGHLRTGQAGRRMVNFIATMKERHSKKPNELYDMIEHCSPASFLELFARDHRRGWVQWGDEIPPGNVNSGKEKVSPRPMEGGMIRPYRMPQLPLPLR